MGSLTEKIAIVICAANGIRRAIAERLANELAAKGVTVNTVSPGFTDTDMLADPVRGIGAQMSPFKRLGEIRRHSGHRRRGDIRGKRWLTGQNIHAGVGVMM
jgi:3-oxoacyl-[acyl-carrier protein] reductase